MAESTIPVDLLNPGQVFACLGVMEAADILLGDAAAAFDWNGGLETTFRVSAAGTKPPVERVLQFLEAATVVTRVPTDSANIDKWLQSWGDRPEIGPPGTPFPFPDPNSPATLPAFLRDYAGTEIALNYWGRRNEARQRQVLGRRGRLPWRGSLAGCS